MNFQEHTKPENLEKYAFLWSEARLVIAALALFLGGIPPVLVLLPVPAIFGLIGMLLTLSWLISGAASGYLAYRWYTGGRKLFGGTDMKDTVAFFVSVVSGINLGLAGITGTNLGMSISTNQGLFMLTALAYLVAGWYLYMRWNKSGKRLFSSEQMSMKI